LHIAKIPSYVDRSANRKTVVDAAKEEIVRKIYLLDLKKKTTAGKLKLREWWSLLRLLETNDTTYAGGRQESGTKSMAKSTWE
jgi:hypothetical protein